MKLKRLALLVGFAAPVCAQYAGPAILTRGEAPSAMSAPEIHFRPFADISAVWDSGLAGVAVNDKGELASQSSYGLQLGWGVSGTHSWRRTKLGLEYRGSTQHYFRQTFYDSIDQSLLLGITHRVTRHSSINIRQSAGFFSRNYGLLNLPQTVPFDPSASVIPTTDYFDNRTIYLTTNVDYAIQKTARLSFDMGGMYFTVARRSSALYDTTGGGAQGDMQYRVSRHTTIGGAYGYQTYRYPHLGRTDGHQVSFSFAHTFSPRLEFSGYAGVGRAEGKFTQVVPVSPVIAILLGITSTTQVAHFVVWGPNVAGRLSRNFARGVAYVGAGHGLTPGNGLFLTSMQTQAFAGYSYTGLRRWSFNAGVGYTRATAYGVIRGGYGGESASVSASRQLIRWVHFTSSYSLRRYDSPDYSKYNRIIQSASVGLGFSPGDIPLRLW